MRFLAPARFTHPRRRSRQTAGQRGKKRFVAPAEMTHTLASRRRLLTIRFIAPAENTHTPWQAALPLFYSASPRWIGSRCRCMKQVACNPQFSSEADHGTMRSPPNPHMVGMIQNLVTLKVRADVTPWETTRPIPGDPMKFARLRVISLNVQQTGCRSDIRTSKFESSIVYDMVGTSSAISSNSVDSFICLFLSLLDHLVHIHALRDAEESLADALDQPLGDQAAVAVEDVVDFVVV